MLLVISTPLSIIETTAAAAAAAAIEGTNDDNRQDDERKEDDLGFLKGVPALSSVGWGVATARKVYKWFRYHNVVEGEGDDKYIKEDYDYYYDKPIYKIVPAVYQTLITLSWLEVIFIIQFSVLLVFIAVVVTKYKLKKKIEYEEHWDPFFRVTWVILGLFLQLFSFLFVGYKESELSRFPLHILVPLVIVLSIVLCLLISHGSKKMVTDDLEPYTEVYFVVDVVAHAFLSGFIALFPMLAVTYNDVTSWPSRFGCILLYIFSILVCCKISILYNPNTVNDHDDHAGEDDKNIKEETRHDNRNSILSHSSSRTYGATASGQSYSFRGKKD